MIGLAPALLIVAQTVGAGHDGVQIEERWSVTDSPFGQIVIVDGVGLSESGEIWVSLPRHGSVVRYTADGEMLDVVAQKGDEAGELQLPSLIARSVVGEMVVLDQVRASLEVFSGSGIFLYRVPLNARILNPKGLTVLASGDFVLSGGSGSSLAAIHQFGRNGRRRRSWSPLPVSYSGLSGRAADASRRLTGGGAVTALESGELLYSQAAPHRIVYFDAGDTIGTLIAADSSTLDSPVDGFHETTTLGAAFNWEFPQSRGIYVRPDGLILNIITLADEGESVWELFDVDGNLRSRSVVPIAYRPWASAGDDVLATVSEGDGVRLVRLRVR